MKMNTSVKSVIGILTIMAVTAECSYAEAQSSNDIRVGVVYDLTPKLANSLQINLSELRKNLDIKSNQRIVIKVDRNGELDLSIYENSVFNSARVDGINQ
jgi:hypothetical protein